jgi:hypothetical protein
MNTFGINFIKTELKPMLKATIKNILHTGEQTISIIDEKEIECAIDDQIVDCTEMNNSTPWIGIPAPAYLEDDEWFGPAPIRTEKQKELIRHQEATERLHEEMRKESGIIESEDIHEKMYKMASANWNTVSESQGGSENFHEGPGGSNGYGWMSGSGR